MMKFRILMTACCMVLVFSCKAQMPVDSTAEKMLVYQLGNGGWPKQLEGGFVVNYSLPLTADLLEKIKATKDLHATFDNKATSREVVFLVKAYKKTKNKAYLKAAEKGLDYILSAQYKNGGWPQYYPDKALYRSEVTYNDDAMINVLNILQDIVTQSNDFDAVGQAYIPKAENAVRNGVSCILKTQFIQNGTLSIWAAQYDKDTLLPAKARNFEPASLSTSESVGIVRFLMRLNQPDAAVKLAVSSAIKWFEAYKISGYKYEDVSAPSLPKGKDRQLVKDASSTVWARFYDLQSNKPIFGDRDNSIKSDVSDLSYERRNGYAWYGSWPEKLIEKEYPKWVTLTK